MTTTLRSLIDVQLGWTWRDQVGTSLVTDSSRLELTKSLGDGDGDDQANAVWHLEEQSLANGESMTLELDMLEQSRFGNTLLIPMSKVRAILVVNENTLGDGYLLVGGASADQWAAPFGASGDTIRVMPGSPLLLSNARDGWDVEVGETALRLAAVGGSVTFSIAILGTLAEGGGGGQSSSSG